MASSVSVAMATFNGLRYLREQLESIQSQTFSPNEIVVCDDASVDGTWDYLLRASEADARMRIFRNPKRLGSTKTFERAINLCCGDIVFLSDQDDVWCPKKIELMTAAMLHCGAVLAMSNGRLVDGNGQDLGTTLWRANGINRRVAEILQSKFAYELLASRGIVTGAALCFKASLKQRMIPIPAEAWHDQWAALMASLTTPGKIILLDRILYDYRQHSNNQLGALSVRRRGNYFRKIMREINSHHDIVRDTAYCQHAIRRLTEDLQHYPENERVPSQHVLTVLEKRLQFSQARCDFIELRVPLHFVFRGARLRAYRSFARGWSTVVRDILCRMWFRLGGNRNPPTPFA